jgi:cobalt-zinc-cadmium efflux system membrane fusion protein
VFFLELWITKNGAGMRMISCKAWMSPALLLILALSVAGCRQGSADSKAEAPPPVTVEHEPDLTIVQVKHPEQFPLAVAKEHAASSELRVTGTVTSDVSRNVPVVSLASGRVVDIRARLGDQVKKGELLMRIQSAEVSGAFSDYQKAVADETLARAQYERAKDLYDHGAMSLNDLQVAQGAEDKAKVELETSAEHLRLLGGDLNHPTGVVDIVAPISGVIIEQNVTAAAGVKTLDNSPNLFTIADLSNVWAMCDVYENDLGNIHIGDSAAIRLNAYPDRVIPGRVSNIGSVLDPSLRTAKVRIEVRNPGMMRVGMFVTATFHGQKKEMRGVVPASAILHLHDRDWVYVPDGAGKFRRLEIVGGDTLPNGMQEIVSGITPGQQVVANALVLQSTAEQ